MKAMKKSITLALALVILLSCMVFPASAGSHTFTDVLAGAWYAEYVQYVYDHGLMNGTSTSTFGPEINMDRAMLVTVLYRMDGSKRVSCSTPFADIKTDGYYYNGLLWAYQNGIINGTSATQFSPDMYITREMMVTIFYRYAQYIDRDVSKLDNLSSYTDADRISSYAKTPFQWAVANGIISGVSINELFPQGTATRAQCATILKRLCEWSEANDPADPTVTEPTTTEPVVTEPATTEPVVTEPATTEPVATEPSTQPTTHTHKFDSYVVYEPDCYTNGEVYFVCACGDSYTEETDPLGHSYGEWVTTSEPTETTFGLAERECSRCGSMEQKRIYMKEPDNCDHGYVDCAADICYNSSNMYRSFCPKCDLEYSFHKLLSVEGGGYICADCGEEYSELEGILYKRGYRLYNDNLMPLEVIKSGAIYTKDRDGVYITCSVVNEDISYDYQVVLARDENFAEPVGTYLSSIREGDEEVYFSYFRDIENYNYIDAVGTFYYMVRTIKLVNGQYAYGPWSEVGEVACFDYLHRLESQNTQYSYEIYFVDSLSMNVYTDEERAIYIKTDNPNPESFRLTIDGKNILRSTVMEYEDVNFLDPDDAYNSLRKVEGGYLGTVYLHDEYGSWIRSAGSNNQFSTECADNEVMITDAGTYTVEIREATYNGYAVANSAEINVKIYEDEEPWYVSVLEDQTNNSMNPREKMDAVAAYLDEYFDRYYVTSDNGYLTLAADYNYAHENNRQNSYTTPNCLYKIAEAIGGFEEIHNCYGDYTAGTDEWYEWHSKVYVVYKGEKYYYSVCPPTSTGYIETIPMIDFQNTSEFTKIVGK